ncbi:hypothetical protein [Marilutibacter alkalisoli]|uniref:Uncharacterized protein n=1 Tax=Marilutibacter alkalisoli TaxID=2591633 RepID=A0A514BU21_9GAMM|nr:hypothetical protein [Lysobacter alkalisoli]QDH70837.1 hypothetical protein FKV23_12660 [Lysobacter alkalisoli]
MAASPNGVIVTIEHVRAARLVGEGVTCAPGIRLWAQRYGIDIRAFLRDGLPVEQIEAIGGPFAMRAASLARAEQETTNE